MNLVTGATGIVGSHVLLELLLQDRPVTACRKKDSDLTHVKKLFSYYVSNSESLFQKIKWIELDILDIASLETALEGIQTVYHCAGLVSFQKKDRERLMAINERGTANVVNACIYKKIDALCHVSSIATINNSDYILPLHEGVFWKTSGRESDYAISKYNGEREVWRGIEEGLNAVIVNPGLILSPGFWAQSSSRLIDTCYRGNQFFTDGVCACIAARDVARAMIFLVGERRFANRYILIENNYSFYELLSSIHTHLKKPLPFIKAPRLLLKLAAGAGSLLSFFSMKPPRITKPIIDSAFNHQLFSNLKVMAALETPFIPAKEAIASICAHYLCEKKIGASSS